MHAVSRLRQAKFSQSLDPFIFVYDIFSIIKSLVVSLSLQIM